MFFRKTPNKEWFQAVRQMDDKKMISLLKAEPNLIHARNKKQENATDIFVQHAFDPGDNIWADIICMETLIKHDADFSKVDLLALEGKFSMELDKESDVVAQMDAYNFFSGMISTLQYRVSEKRYKERISQQQIAANKKADNAKKEKTEEVRYFPDAHPLAIIKSTKFPEGRTDLHVDFKQNRGMRVEIKPLSEFDPEEVEELKQQLEARGVQVPKLKS